MEISIFLSVTDNQEHFLIGLLSQLTMEPRTLVASCPTHLVKGRGGQIMALAEFEWPPVLSKQDVTSLSRLVVAKSNRLFYVQFQSVDVSLHALLELRTNLWKCTLENLHRPRKGNETSECLSVRFGVVNPWLGRRANEGGKRKWMKEGKGRKAAIPMSVSGNIVYLD